MKIKLLFPLISLVLLLLPSANFAQLPDLGAATGFALFTVAGAFSSTGATTITGDIGTNLGAFTGFPPGTVTGQTHIVDSTSGEAATDVDAAYNYLNGIICGAVIGTVLGNNQVLTPNVYCSGAISTLNGDLILDGEGDSNAVFIVKVDGALTTNAFSNVILINSTRTSNVYWQINGAFDAGESSVFKGTIITNGAINLMEGASITGRGLSRGGAISLHNNSVDLGIQPSNPLPVTLVSFNAGIYDTKTSIYLSWETISEFNSAYFIIERSTDGINFKAIGEHIAAGSSTGLLSYFFVDKNPDHGINYYRLNQFDLDGKHEYYLTKAVDFSNTILAINIYPTPFTNSINIFINNDLSVNTIELIIYNTLGMEVMSSVISGQLTTLTTSNLSSGVYFYKITDSNKILKSGILISNK